MEILYPKNARFLLLALIGAILTCLSYLTYVYNPKEFIVKTVTTLAPGSLAFNLWSAPPYDLVAKLYIFNVTNAEEFLRGEEKLKFNEVGPYAYSEKLINTETKFNDNGTLSFIPRRKLAFVPEQSIGDPKVDVLKLPNVPLLGITASLVDSSMFLNLGVASVSNYLDSKSILDLTVNEYLWGYDDPLVDFANKMVPNWIDFPRFGILDRLYALDNGTNVVTINVDPKTLSPTPYLSEEEKKKPYAIHRWNGSPGFHQWGYRDGEDDVPNSPNSKCNTLEGSFEGTIYPRHIKPNSTFKLYRPAFCRPVPMLQYSSAVSSDGFTGLAYKMAPTFLETPDVNPDNACFCRKGQCLPKGLGDMTPCYYSIPIALSQPHFLNADPQLLEQIDGLNPSDEKHESLMLLHQEMGIPLQAQLKIQINLRMPETRYNSRTRPFNNMVIPLFWVELNLERVPSEVYLYLTLLFHVLPVAQEILMYGCGVGGLFLVSLSAFAVLFYNPSKDEDEFGLNVNYSPLKVITLKTEHLTDVRIHK